MLFYGNFALISPASLLQLVCQERRSVLISAWHGTSSASVCISQGKMVEARCAGLVGAEAIYHLLSWDYGQFRLEPVSTVADVQPLAGWQELLLEAARRRDEHPSNGVELLPEVGRQQLTALRDVCPALAALALVGYDGRLLAEIAMTDILGAHLLTLAGCLSAMGTVLGGNSSVTLYLNGPHKILLADWGDQSFVLAVPLPEARMSDAVNQLACWTPKTKWWPLAPLVR